MCRIPKSMVSKSLKYKVSRKPCACKTARCVDSLNLYDRHGSVRLVAKASDCKSPTMKHRWFDSNLALLAFCCGSNAQFPSPDWEK